jgi:hypothetical protein
VVAIAAVRGFQPRISPNPSQEEQMPNIKVVPTAEYDLVVSAVQLYVDGLRAGRAEDVAMAFHEDAIMYGFTNGELLGGTIRNLYEFVDQNGDAPDIVTRLDVLGITPTTAVVRVDMENDAIGADYTDFHTLLKQVGQWKVIAKTYHQYDD